MPSISAVTCVVGDSGSGKSVLVATFAKWVWARHKAPTRLYHFDPGGWNDELQELIRAGIVEVWKVYTRDILGESTLVTETLMRASQGWWPVEIDPETGNTPHAAKLAPPPPDWRGAVAYDGISSMCAWAENEMGVRAAAGTLGGEGSNMKPIFSGEMKSGSGNRASIGFIQNEARKWVLAMLSQKGLVAPPVVTSLEAKVTDSETKLMLCGPKLSGQAKTPDSLAWLGNTLGAWMDNGEHRLYLRDYKWPAGDTAPHKCKVRAKPAVVAQLPEYLSDGPGNASLTKFNLGYFFDLLDELSAKEAEKGKALLEGAPGMKASTIQAQTATPAAGTPAAAAAAAGPAAPAKPGAMKLQPRPAAAQVPVSPGGASPAGVQPAPAPAPAPAPTPAAPAAPPAAAPTPQPQATTVSGVKPAAPAAPAPAAPLRPAPAGMKPLARAPVPAAPAQKK